MTLLVDFVLVATVTIAILLLIWLRRRLNYFKDRNIPYLKSPPLFGAMCDVFLGKNGLYEVSEKIYKNPKLKNEPFFGIFMFHKPAIFIKNPELIKRIFVKDFNSFTNHHAYSDDHDPLGIHNLFSSKDAIWRTLRRKLTPFFTSGKMKSIFLIVDKIGDDLMKHIEAKSHYKNSLELNIKNTTSLFALDIIGSCAFGIESKCLENPNSEFIRIAYKFSNFTFYRGIEFTAIFLLPEITKFFNFKFFTQDGEKFIMRTMKDIMEQREKSGTKRNDLIDTLIEIKNEANKNENGEKITLEMLIAQAAAFFSAGHEPSSTVTSFALYELAKHPNIQNKVKEELREKLQNTDKKVTYDLVMHDTPYLQQVLSEISRLYPTIPLLDRECTNPNGYSLEPFSDFIIPPKMPVYIPLYGLHRDEKYFDDPLRFNPERFSPENIRNIPANVYMPFGSGNRVCIGERLGLMLAKTAIIKILKKYRVSFTSTTPEKIKLAKNAILIQSEVPLILKLDKDEI